jgi:uncharacterized protein YbjT (DUF2867 family)
MTKFRVIMMGGTGQVGAAVVRALVKSPACLEVVLINRRLAEPVWGPLVRQVVLDPGSEAFGGEVAELVKASATGEATLHAVSCLGVGAGSNKLSEDELKKLEVGIVGAFARGCHAGGIRHFCLLSAAGSSSSSSLRYARIMGLKEETVRAAGFDRVEIFRPGIIAGNAHTPGAVAVLGRLFPGAMNTIDQEDIAGAFAAEIARAAPPGVRLLNNRDMRALARGGT